jgi:YidC/Oxa1 family membrane protein insertase
MDRNTIIGFSLIFLILVGYYWWAAPSQAEMDIQRKAADSIARVDAKSDTTQPTQNAADTASLNEKSANSQDSVINGFLDCKYQKPHEITLANSAVSIKFSSLGGRPVQVKLNRYKRADSTDLVLLDAKQTGR